ncbi:hypothetical protein [Neolewinella antarctica]|uniref:DUF4843 domain-containing protein n=1 Tax=Neolewinella antarctica TaxID=442734 RepID=A0ABX0XCR5_9BACT|nr:hypothetical protein [Neolewinella antarctica]NJC26736.1 hypothetical protein [Neolewinella antarctica]
MHKLTFSLLAFLAIGLFSCENEYENIYPSIADQEISFKVDGQAQSFKTLPNTYGPGSVFTYEGANPGSNFLDMARASEDGTTVITISAKDLPVEKAAGQINYVGRGLTPATITITSTEMSGSIYCPHYEGTDEMTYQGFIRFDNIDAAGALKGEFSSDKRDDSNPELRDGSFDLKLGVTEY